MEKRILENFKKREVVIAKPQLKLKISLNSKAKHFNYLQELENLRYDLSAVQAR